APTAAAGEAVPPAPAPPPGPAPGAAAPDAPASDGPAVADPPVPGGNADAEADDDEGFPPAPPPPPDVFDEEDGGPALVGFHSGRLYIRDAKDDFRLYPGARLRTDFHSSFGPGVTDLPETVSGGAERPELALRRVRLEMSGEIMKRLAFTVGVELGGERVGEPGAGGDGPGSAAARFAAPRATSGRVQPAEVSVSYKFRPWLNVTIGQSNVAFSMQNRTREHLLPMMERALGIRGFAVPHEKELGATVWGELPLKVIAYEYGIYNGDGPARPGADLRADFTGRIYARPLAFSGKSTFKRWFQIGVSARYGERQQSAVTYEHPSIATAQGFVMWLPRYEDSLGRLTHVLPSGAQRSIGGEVRLPFDLPEGLGIDIRAEAYAVANNTREAVDGFELVSTERLGRVLGVGWYGEVDLWLCGDTFVDGEPGLWRPPTVDLSKDSESKHGLELVVTASGINATYDPAARDGTADAAEPSAALTSYEVGGALQYWWGPNFRAALNYLAYVAPHAGDRAQSHLLVAGNLATDDDGVPRAAEVSHELGGRVAVTF
ncbi:MAG: hypothetical protein HY908_12425, partial [Myxococcales bacterium]|nr:hypothetical protein [Myxococcales bacterium]